MLSATAQRRMRRGRAQSFEQFHRWHRRHWAARAPPQLTISRAATIGEFECQRRRASPLHQPRDGRWRRIHDQHRGARRQPLITPVARLAQRPRADPRSPRSTWRRCDPRRPARRPASWTSPWSPHRHAQQRRDHPRPSAAATRVGQVEPPRGVGLAAASPAARSVSSSAAGLRDTDAAIVGHPDVGQCPRQALPRRMPGADRRRGSASPPHTIPAPGSDPLRHARRCLVRSRDRDAAPRGPARSAPSTGRSRSVDDRISGACARPEQDTTAPQVGATMPSPRP